MYRPFPVVQHMPSLKRSVIVNLYSPEDRQYPIYSREREGKFYEIIELMELELSRRCSSGRFINDHCSRAE